MDSEAFKKWSRVRGNLASPEDDFKAGQCAAKAHRIACEHPTCCLWLHQHRKLVFRVADSENVCNCACLACAAVTERDLAQAKCAEFAKFIEDHEIHDNSGQEYPPTCIACDIPIGRHEKNCSLVAILKDNSGQHLLDRLAKLERVRKAVVAYLPPQFGRFGPIGVSIEAEELVKALAASCCEK